MLLVHTIVHTIPPQPIPHPISNTQVEIKLRLHSKEDHDAIATLLASQHKATYAQENYFFDGSQAEFSSRRTIVRVRLYNTDEKATLTVKVWCWGVVLLVVVVRFCVGFVVVVCCVAQAYAMQNS